MLGRHPAAPQGMRRRATRARSDCAVGFAGDHSDRQPGQGGSRLVPIPLTMPTALSWGHVCAAAGPALAGAVETWNPLVVIGSNHLTRSLPELLIAA